MKSIADGVYSAAITPRRPGVQDINLGSMWELIDFLSDKRLSGIVLMGATGEFVHFSNSERMRMMGLAPKRSRVPVLFNVSHSTLDGAVELAQAAAASGAAGLLLMPPYFFRYSEDDLRAFYERFMSEAGVPIPVLLYHLPQFGNGIPFDLAVSLIREGVVQGIKDSSGSPEYLSRLQKARSEGLDFTLMVGNDGALRTAFRDGISGAISGCACAVPELLTALFQAMQDADEERAASLHLRLQEFIRGIDEFPVPVGIREAAILRGCKLGPNATPLGIEGKQRLEAFRSWFREWLPGVLAECRDA